MKKLMLIAAAAAMTNAFAITQVYDMRINLKTTECKDANLGPNQNPFITVAAGTTLPIAYRAVSTTTIVGLIWACDCEYIADLGQTKGPNLLPGDVGAQAANAARRLPALPAGGGTSPAAAAGPNSWRWYTWADTQTYAPAVPQSTLGDYGRTEGYIFWNARTRKPWGYSTIDKAGSNDPANWTIPQINTGDNPMPTLRWTLLQRIGVRAEMVEGSWILEELHSNVGGGMYNLVGSGFGQARTGSVGAGGAGAIPGTLPAALTGYDAGLAAVHECGEAIITSMSGNVAGFITPTDSNGGCVFCGSVGCTFFPFCNCAIGFPGDSRTAAYGTWTLKYNASLSRSLLGHLSIRECTRFEADTEDMVRFLETWAVRR
jgi:hypothetical protein